mmetsp:Transcript_51808/g.130097  ORF Transcript_51808/g.130097 Transcript_51808/m.130097 type:complete len:209 (-) Transcript_51808:2457-3083(-)
MGHSLLRYLRQHLSHRHMWRQGLSTMVARSSKQTTHFCRSSAFLLACTSSSRSCRSWSDTPARRPISRSRADASCCMASWMSLWKLRTPSWSVCSSRSADNLSMLAESRQPTSACSSRTDASKSRIFLCAASLSFTVPSRRAFILSFSSVRVWACRWAAAMVSPLLAFSLLATSSCFSNLVLSCLASFWALVHSCFACCSDVLRDLTF